MLALLVSTATAGEALPPIGHLVVVGWRANDGGDWAMGVAWR